MSGSFASDFEGLLAVELEDPDFRAAYEDEQTFHRVLDQLVEFRKTAELTQGIVAERMGVKQPTVSGFENESSDPKLMTLLRYARAVGARIEIRVVRREFADAEHADGKKRAVYIPQVKPRAFGEPRKDESLAPVIDIMAFKGHPSKCLYSDSQPSTAAV